MILVTLSTGKDGALIECKANGHACFSQKGTDIVCAAVTTLLKTSMQVLSQIEEVTLNADTSERGNLAFRVSVNKESDSVKTRLQCTADFIRTGIKSLSASYPENVQLREN